MKVNVREFGAAGDGIVKDTLALQKAIDVCAEAGGGRVKVPAGVYLTGTLWLKSHVELHLCMGASLLGSPDVEDYNEEGAVPEKKAFSRENVTDRHLIIAYRQKNIAITGLGTINGNSPAFFEPKEAPGGYRWKKGNFVQRDWRPGQMILLCCCQDVLVQDISLRDSTYWGLFLLGCEDVRVRGLLIENPPLTPNGDGIDIDCSRNVTVSDCIIRSGDDAITLRAAGALLRNKLPCENVVVSNCVLSTPCNAIRVGVGDGVIRNCRFENIVIHESRTGISIVSKYSEGASHGVYIERVGFHGIQMDVCIPLSVHCGENPALPAGIQDIVFSNMECRVSASGQLLGTEDLPLRRVNMRDCTFLVNGGTENLEYVKEWPEKVRHFGFPGMGGAPALPTVLYGRYMVDCTWERVNVRWENSSPVWRECMRLEDTIGQKLWGLNLEKPKKVRGDEAYIRVFCAEQLSVRDVTDAFGNVIEENLLCEAENRPITV